MAGETSPQWTAVLTIRVCHRSLGRHVEIWVSGEQKQRQDCGGKSAETDAVKMLEEGGVTLKLPRQMMLIIVLCSPAHQSPRLYSADTSSSCLLSNGHTFFCLCLHANLLLPLYFTKRPCLFCQPFCVSTMILNLVCYQVPAG